MFAQIETILGEGQFGGGEGQKKNLGGHLPPLHPPSAATDLMQDVVLGRTLVIFPFSKQILNYHDESLSVH